MTQSSCCHQRIILDTDTMMNFKALLEPTQNADGVLNSRLIYHNRLETPLQSSILLDILTVFIKSGCTDTVQLAASQHWFQHVTGVNGPFRLAGTDDGVQFIDEEQNPTVTFADLIKYSLESFLKFAAVFGSSKQRPHVERKNCLIFKPFRDIAPDDSLRQAFNNGRFANTWLTDKNRVVLGFAREDTDHSPDLGVPADYRVKLALMNLFNQVKSVFIKGFVGSFRICTGHSLVAAYSSQHLEQSIPGQVELLENFARSSFAAFIGHRQK